MLQYAIKVVVTAIVVVAVSEIGKRNSLLAGVLASLPLTSLLAFIWLYHGTGDVEAVVRLSHSIFWLVFASLPLFVVFPALLRNEIAFWPALGVACIATAGAYFGLVRVLGYLGVRL